MFKGKYFLVFFTGEFYFEKNPPESKSTLFEFIYKS